MILCLSARQDFVVISTISLSGVGCRPATDKHTEAASAMVMWAEAGGPADEEAQRPRSATDEKVRRPLSAADEGDRGRVLAAN